MVFLFRVLPDHKRLVKGVKSTSSSFVTLPTDWSLATLAVVVAQRKCMGNVPALFQAHDDFLNKVQRKGFIWMTDNYIHIPANLFATPVATDNDQLELEAKLLDMC